MVVRGTEKWHAADSRRAFGMLGWSLELSEVREIVGTSRAIPRGMTILASRVGITHTALFALLLGSAASVACNKEEDTSQKRTWACNDEEVPMGGVVRCVSQAATADGPVTGSTPVSTGGTTDGTAGGGSGSGTTDGTTGGTTSDGTSGGDDGSTSYDCGPESPNADCPPSDVGGGTSDGTTGSSGNDGDDTSGDTPSDGKPNGGGTSDGTNPGGGSSGNSSGGGGSSSTTGDEVPSECGYVPDLPYCPPGSSGGTSDGTAGSSGSSGGCTDKCPPGQEKKDGGSSSSGGASSSSSGGNNGKTGDGTAGSSGSSGSSGASGSSGSDGGGGKHWKCKKDKKGTIECESAPDCASGSHPSSCGACVDDGDSSDCVPPSEGGCWVTGGGFIVADSVVPAAPADGHDNYGGNAKPMKKGYVSGHWNHVDHGTGNHAKGRPEYIFCRHVDEPGPGQPGGKKGLTSNQVYFGGHAEWREAATGAWADGYWFDVVAKDHGEPGSQPSAKNGGMVDTYHFTIRKMSDPAAQTSGAIVYETKGPLIGGNIQIHPPNNGHPATSSPLPAWVSLEP